MFYFSFIKFTPKFTRYLKCERTETKRNLTMHPSVISYPTRASPLRWYDIIYNQGENTEETATRRKEEIYFSNFSTVPPPPDYQKIASSLISINAPLETRRGRNLRRHSARTFSSPRVLERWCRKGTGTSCGRSGSRAVLSGGHEGGKGRRSLALGIQTKL